MAKPIWVINGKTDMEVEALYKVKVKEEHLTNCDEVGQLEMP